MFGSLNLPRGGVANPEYTGKSDTRPEADLIELEGLFFIPPYANKHVFPVRPAAAFGGCLHACSRRGPGSLVSLIRKLTFSSRKRDKSSNCFSVGPSRRFRGAHMLVRHHACSRKPVLISGSVILHSGGVILI